MFFRGDINIFTVNKRQEDVSKHTLLLLSELGNQFLKISPVSSASMMMG